jgi:DNA-directed RNA polymerase subunit RPC12/RpoP
MAKKRTRIELKCSNCGRVLGTMPEGDALASPLVCPNCGTILEPPGPVERLAGEVKGAIGRITGRGSEEKSE